MIPFSLSIAFLSVPFMIAIYEASSMRSIYTRSHGARSSLVIGWSWFSSSGHRTPEDSEPSIFCLYLWSVYVGYWLLVCI